MKHSFTNYYVQSKKTDERPQIVCHSKDDETGEMYHKFLDKKKAVKLMEDEKKVSPEYKYRIMKETTTYEEGVWS
jgi:hypothetical protein